MKTWEEKYKEWNTFDQLNKDLKDELALLQDLAELEDAFYKELTFGTGGIRGILGPGTNRMNRYTVRRVVYGLANYLLENQVNVKDRGVVISYDSRFKSKEFAIEAANVLSYFGIKAYVFDAIRPTPLLSFAVRYLGAVAGIMITASHNPPKYNGLKIYNEDGGQITPVEANKVSAFIGDVEDELYIPVDEGNIEWLSREIDNAYLERLQFISRLSPDEKRVEKELKIVFTPLHGTSHDLITAGLKQLHFSHVHVVKEQVMPDPHFPTEVSPNPEDREAFTMAMELGKEVDADILLATDPDSDRLGVAVKQSKGNYRVLTGNQLGVLLLEYILKNSDLNIYQSPRMIKTIVTTELGEKIAQSYDVKTFNTLTGFTYIGEKIRRFDTTGETFLFGFGESDGFLIDGFVREKDAVQAAVLTAEMAYALQKQGKTLIDALNDLYEKYGYYLEGMSSLTLEGKDGTAKMELIMAGMRTNVFTKIGGFQIEAIEDYLTGERQYLENKNVNQIPLPKENMIKFHLADNAWAALRPSGTEPKLKCYYGVCGKSSKESEQKLEKLKTAMEEIIEETLAVVRVNM